MTGPPSTDAQAMDKDDYSSSYFEDEYYEILEEMEEKHFWYWGRYKLITRIFLDSIKENKTSGQLSCIDLGCGTGGWLLRLTELRSMTWRRLAGADCSTTSIEKCVKKLPNYVELHRCDLNHLRYENEWDVAFLLDSLEYCDNDIKTLSATRRGLRDGGLAIIAVPAYKWMWSETDVINGNQRRYNKRQLYNLCEASGLKALSVTSFNALLLPAYLLSRMTWRKAKARQHLTAEEKAEILKKNHKTPPRLINRAMKLIMNLELAISRIKSFPFGTSFILVASK